MTPEAEKRERKLERMLRLKIAVADLVYVAAIVAAGLVVLR